jgi:predicted AlkP superfamily phosphohydrolase/phosphomutase
LPLNASKTRVLIIGLDGGTWTVLRPAIERGHMPFLKGLIDNGASGILSSTIPALTPPAWAAFQTGMNPGKTGVFSFTMLDTAKRRMDFVSATLLAQTLWDLATQAGRKVVVLNVPLTYPPRQVNGCMVTGLMTPSMDSDFTWPGELKTELLKAIPGYHLPRMGNDSGLPACREVGPFVKRMAAATENTARAAEYLIGKESPELCMVHFQSTDLVQHGLWCYLDPSDKRYDAASHELILKEFYGALDRSIRIAHESFVKAGGDVTTFVASDHGFESHRKRFNLGTWLYREGLLCRDAKLEKPPLRKRISRALRVGKLLRMIISNERVERLESALKVAPEVVNWDTSLTYAVGYCSEGGIYLLQKPSPESAKTASGLKEKLMALKDPATGLRFIKAVYQKEEIYHGSRMDLMPDLIVVPVSGYTCTGFCVPDSPLLEEVDEDNPHIGKHHADGIVVASGEPIRGRFVETPSLLDITPTVLYALGLDIPGDCDGKVITSIFSDEFLSLRGSPRHNAASEEQPPSTSVDAYSSQDQEQIQKKLRDLGYM